MCFDVECHRQSNIPCSPLNASDAEDRATLARDMVTDLEERVRQLEASVASMQAELLQKEEEVILARETAGAEADGMARQCKP